MSVVALALVAAAAWSPPTVPRSPSSRAGAVKMVASYPPGVWDEWEECIVNAENALEQAACNGATVSQKVVKFMQERAGKYRSLRVVPPDECMVDAENALEQAACFEA